MDLLRLLLNRGEKTSKTFFRYFWDPRCCFLAHHSSSLFVFIQRVRKDSNLRPATLEIAALPAELHTQQLSAIKTIIALTARQSFLLP